MEKIVYQVENDLSPQAFQDILVRSTLGERRPVDDFTRLTGMCKNADIIITARCDGQLIGVSRAISDFSFATYLSDLAVDVKFQRQGIGKRLILETKKQAPQATLTLLAAPAAVDYYPGIGMSHHPHCFRLTDINDLKIKL